MANRLTPCPLVPRAPGDPTITKQHAWREDQPRTTNPLAEPMFMSHPTITEVQGLLPREPRAKPGKEVTLHQRPPTFPKGPGTAGAGRRARLRSVSSSLRLPGRGKGTASPPHSPPPRRRPVPEWGSLGPGPPPAPAVPGAQRGRGVAPC